MMIIAVVLVFFILGSIPFIFGEKGQPEREEPVHRPDARFFARKSANSSTPNWLAIYLADCESPAEEAFLRSMFPAYALEPSDGMLVGSGIRMNLQVEVKRYEKNNAWRLYRFDFLINDWLVVEIDGAAHHSSLEALKRDSLRDSFLRDKRFTTLHLPAKLVFNTPAEAIRRVQAALDEGPQPIAAPPAKSGKISFIESMNDHMDRSKKFDEVDKILRLSAFRSAKTMIDSIIKLETHEMERTGKNGLDNLNYVGSPRSYADNVMSDMARTNINNNFASARNFDPSIARRPTSAFTNSDPYIAATLARVHRDIKSGIPYYFKIVQAKLRGNIELASRVEKHLAMLNCTTCIDAIRTNYDV